MTLEFIDGDPPPPKRNTRGRAADLLPALKAQPGRWAVVGTYDTDTYGKCSALVASLKKHDAEAVMRQTQPGVWAVYARWPVAGTVVKIGRADQGTERAAAIYNEATEAGRSGIKAVCEAFGCSEAVASRTIRKARNAGLVPELGSAS